MTMVTTPAKSLVEPFTIHGIIIEDAESFVIGSYPTV